MGLKWVLVWLSAQASNGSGPWVPSAWVPPQKASAVYPSETLADQLSLLQVKVQKAGLRHNSSLNESYFYKREGGPGFPFECGQEHPEDLYRPVIEVLNEHPGVDGMCYFSFAAFWFGYNPTHDYLSSAKGGILGMRENPATCVDWRGHASGERQVAVWELGTVTSHIDCNYYQYDDLYFYSLGWLKNQRLDGSLMSNYDAWRELAAEECEKIRQEYHFTPEETSVGRHVDDNELISLHSNCAWSGTDDCQRPTVREYKLHIYTKCLLGHAADEMAYGYFRACLLPGNVIGHGPECGTCPDGNPCP